MAFQQTHWRVKQSSYRRDSKMVDFLGELSSFLVYIKLNCYISRILPPTFSSSHCGLLQSQRRLSHITRNHRYRQWIPTKFRNLKTTNSLFKHHFVFPFHTFHKKPNGNSNIIIKFKFQNPTTPQFPNNLRCTELQFELSLDPVLLTPPPRRLEHLH